MASSNNRLSAKRVDTVSKAGLYHDGGGLYLQVSKRGSKSWLYIYTLNKRTREMGLGSVGIVTLAEARAKVADAKKLLAQKVDPIEARQSQEAEAILAAANQMTFQQCAEKYIEAHEQGWTNPKHKQQWKNTLATYAYPIIGKYSVQHINTNFMMKVLEPIWKDKTETADRLRGRIERVLDWAAVRGMRQGDNPARWKGHLDKLLIGRGKIQRVEHHPALPYAEVGDFVALLKQQPGLDACALEFTILTATRTNESIGAKWEEIDLENKTWVIPGERMKMKREHRIPLSDRAVSVLKHAMHLTSDKKNPNINEQTGWVFPGRKKIKSLSNMAMLALLRRIKRDDITVHGFRSTFRDWAAEQTAYPREVAEAALAHAVDSKVEAAYFRSDLFDKRRKLMDAWAKYCATPSVKTGGGVVSIADARRAKASPKR